MNSPRQARPTSTPKAVTFAKGGGSFAPLTPAKRITPTKKYVAPLCNNGTMGSSGSKGY